MKNPKLAIYIPTFMRPKSTFETLRALNKLDFTNNPNVCIHVSDNCPLNSQYSIVDLLESTYPSVNFSSNHDNLGYIFNFLKFFSVCKADYIWVLGSDDIPIVQADKLFSVLEGLDFLTVYDNSLDCRLLEENESFFSVEDYLTNVFEPPFGWVSSSIIKLELLNVALSKISLKQLVYSGYNPQALLYNIASTYSESFLALPGTRSFVSANRIAEEAYITLNIEIKTFQLSLFKKFSRWSISWFITSLYISHILSNHPQSHVFTKNWRRIILEKVPNFNINARFSSYSLSSRVMSCMNILFRDPSGFIKFIIGLLQSPFYHTGRLWLLYILGFDSRFIFSMINSFEIVNPYIGSKLLVHLSLIFPEKE